MKHLLRLYVLITIQFVISLACFSQTFNFRNYNVESGLSNDQILCFFQDKDGVVWMGTNGGGINKFDGKSFEHLTTKDSLADNVVYSITGDKQGTIYVGTNNGMSVIKNRKITNYRERKQDENFGLSHYRVYKVFIDSNNKIWIGTGRGINQLEGTKITTKTLHKELDKSFVFDIMQDSNKAIWFSTLGAGAFKYDGSELKQYTVDNGLDENFIFNVFDYSKQEKWISTSTSLYVLKNEKLEKHPISKQYFQEGNYLYGCWRDGFNSIWIGTNEGVYHLENDSLDLILKKENGLVNKDIWKIFIDNEQNIWLGSKAEKESGLSVLNNLSFSKKTIVTDSIGKSINDLLLDRNGNLWLATSKHLLRIAPNNNTKVFKGGNENGLTHEKIRCLYEDNEKIYIGTENGISILLNNKWHIITPKNTEEKEYRINDIISFNGEILVATNKGIWRIEGKTMLEYHPSHFSHLVVNKLFTNEDKTLWIGSETGILNISKNIVRSFSISDGISNRKIYDIAEENGFVWALSEDGIYKYANSTGRFMYQKIKDDIKESTSISFGIEKVILIGTESGLYKYKLIDNKLVLIKKYDQANGFTNTAVSHRAQKWYNNKLYIGTEDGLFIYNPRYDRENKLAPQTRIKEIRLYAQPTNWKEYADSIGTDGLPYNLILTSGQNYLSFSYVGVSHTLPTKVKYKYTLKGHDKDWHSTTETTVLFSNLNPGDYEFLVLAENGDGVWNKEPVSFKFTINPPLHLSNLAYTIYLLVAIGFIYAFLRIVRSNGKIKEQNSTIEKNNAQLAFAFKEIEQTNKNITDSILYAKRIQDAILPRKKKIYNVLPQSFVFYKPKDIVSGDFYWLHEQGDHLLIAAVDCTGHGVPGAFVSIVGNDGLLRAVNEFGLTVPGKIMDKLNSLVEETLRHDDTTFVRDGMDMALCAINFKNKTVSYSGAQNPLYIIRKKEYGTPLPEAKALISTETHQLFELKADKQPIGFFEGRKNFTTHTISAMPDDTFYIFSDGYADQFGGPKGKKFMYKKFKELLLNIQNLTIIEQRQVLESSFDAWRGNLEQVDDVCVIGFKIG
ncbi:MAG: SpoIIE family protein phosphatase [Bacteroidetes bacterium]|nr:SpoIIE family protein phosphatase [Bacteroidota bacterium]